MMTLIAPRVDAGIHHVVIEVRGWSAKEGVKFLQTMNNLWKWNARIMKMGKRTCVVVEYPKDVVFYYAHGAVLTEVYNVQEK